MDNSNSSQLTFTVLQKAISWDPDSQRYELRFRDLECDLECDEIGKKNDRDITFNDASGGKIGSIVMTLDQMALLERDFESNLKDTERKQLLKDKVSIFFYLEKLAGDIGLYKSGVFGASYVNAGNDPDDKENYGKTQKHLALGSLNIPSEKHGKESVDSLTQYYYFTLSRETEAILEENEENSSEKRKNEAGTKNKEKERYLSEIKQIFEAANAVSSDKKHSSMTGKLFQKRSTYVMNISSCLL